MTDPTMEPITARYSWNAQGLADALEVHRKQSSGTIGRRVLFWSLVALSLFMALVPLRILASPDDLQGKLFPLVFWTALVVYLWGVMYLAFWSKAILRWRAKKLFKHVAGGARDVEWMIDQDQLGNRTQLAASTFLWPLFLKAVESPKGISLYQNIGFFHWIPAHAFVSAGELKRFTDMARSKITDYKVLGECRFPIKPDPTGLDEL